MSLKIMLSSYDRSILPTLSGQQDHYTSPAIYGYGSTNEYPPEACIIILVDQYYYYYYYM